MKHETILTAKILCVTVRDIGSELYYGYNPSQEERTWKCFEMENGIIWVPGDSEPDWFFNSREDIQGCGSDEVVSVEETEETREFTSLEFLRAIQAAYKYYDGAVPANHFELWK